MAAPLGHKKYGGKVKGSTSVGSGRTPDAFKAKCQAILERKNLLDYVGRVASGEEKEIYINSLGVKHKKPCDTKDRLKAVEMIKDWGYGKAVQNFESSDFGEVLKIIRERADKLSQMPQLK